jgi:hypothetical protein
MSINDLIQAARDEDREAFQTGFGKSIDQRVLNTLDDKRGPVGTQLFDKDDENTEEEPSSE